MSILRLVNTDMRTQEVRGMVRARKMGVLTAVLYAVDLHDATISMERVDGSTVKALLHSGGLAREGAVACSCFCICICHAHFATGRSEL